MEDGTISKANILKPAEDYNLLRKQGIKNLEKLAGNVWTDYNTHDPGITLLEALCYAITDLAYRTGYDMKDLLAPKTLTKDSWKKIFYTARQILPCNPVTISDYRKLLVDIVGVRNAWIKPSKDYEVPIYINYPADFEDEQKKFNDSDKPNPCGDTPTVPVELGFEADKDPATKDKVIELNGLYKIIIEYEEDVIEKLHREKVRQKVINKLNSHRSLCEDFLTVTAAEYKPFNLKTHVLLKEDADADRVLAQICFIIQNYFTPSVKFYTIEELRELAHKDENGNPKKGYATEEIFEGPFLDHGFIPDFVIENTDVFRDMRLSDLVNDVMDIEGVIALQKFMVNDLVNPDDDDPDLCTVSDFFDEWIAEMKRDGLVGKLDVDDVIANVNNEDELNPDNSLKKEAPFKFFKSFGRVNINTRRFEKLLKDLKAFDRNRKLVGHTTDLPVPFGENKELEDYYPVQYSLPDVYGVGEAGLDSPTPARTNQALQLKAYLAVFEQLLSDYLAQLANVRDLFSFDENVTTTSGVQSLLEGTLGYNPKNDHGITEYFKIYLHAENYLNDLKNMNEPPEDFEWRRNKFLDHLMARFSQELDEYSSLTKYMYPRDYIARLITNKTDLLSDYPNISRNRARAFNYKLKEECKEYPNEVDEETKRNNVSGLERRISRLIGCKDFRRKTLAPENFRFVYTDTGKTKGRIILYEDFEDKTILLQSDEIKTACEDEIMHCFIESGCCAKNFIKLPEHKEISRRRRHARNDYSFILVDKDDGKTLATSDFFPTSEERDKALEKAINALQPICHDEALHMIEHILLRPKGDSEEDGIFYELLNICIDKCDLNIGVSEIVARYKFDISIVPGKKCGDSRWKVQLNQIKDPDHPVTIFEQIYRDYDGVSKFISSIREYGSEFENYKVFNSDDESSPDKYFFRLVDENGNLVAESITCYSSAGTDPITKKKKMPPGKKINTCSTVIAGAAWDEIQGLKGTSPTTQVQGLKAFLSYELDLYGCEDSCDNNEDPYSFRVSFVLPCWPKRFRDKSFRNFVERTIQSETPAHIHARIYWLGIEQMRRFEQTYFEWIIEMACNDVPDIEIANDFITVVKGLKNCDDPCAEDTTIKNA